MLKELGVSIQNLGFILDVNIFCSKMCEIFKHIVHASGNPYFAYL